MNIGNIEKGFESLIHHLEGKGAVSMATTSMPVPVVDPTPTPTAPTHPNAGQIIDTVLHDVIFFGVIAASIFVKNPKSQNKAASIISAVQSLLAFLDPQLTGQK